jgi:hypothetical protein
MATRSRSGASLKLAGLALLVAGGLVYGLLGDPEENPLALLGPVIMIGGALLHFRSRQLAARATAAESNPVQSGADRAQVLYLRAFATDPWSPVKILMSGLSTEEEQLGAVLETFGKLVAIGRPGEPLPLPGAQRVYASNDDWQRRVVELMQACELVVIRAGAGSGLSWEFQQLFARLRPEQVVILLLRTSASDYAELAQMLKRGFDVSLPDVPRLGWLSALVDVREGRADLRPGFVCFSAGWRPRFLPLPRTLMRLGYNDLLGPFNDALRPVFDAHRIAWRPRGRLHRGQP